MKNNNSEYFCPDGSDLASRQSARILRVKVEQAIEMGKVAIIDLTNVISISESYADELLAVLVQQHGLEWFSEKVKLLHQSSNSDHILRSVAISIQHRLDNQKIVTSKSFINELIATKKSNASKNFSHDYA